MAPAVPLGVTDEPAPPDVAGIYSVKIGNNGAARFAEMLSHGTAELNKLLVRYAQIEKYFPPWWGE